MRKCDRCGSETDILVSCVNVKQGHVLLCGRCVLRSIGDGKGREIKARTFNGIPREKRKACTHARTLAGYRG